MKKIFYLLLTALIAGVVAAILQVTEASTASQFIQAGLFGGIVSGEIRGKVGNLLFTKWKGIPVVKSKPVEVSNPNTARQQTQRSKFALAQKVASEFLTAIQVGMKAYAVKMSEYNFFIKEALISMITGTDENPVIEPQNLKISKGNLPEIVNPFLTSPAADTLTIDWDDNSAEEGAAATDLITLVAFGDVENKVKAIILTAERSSKSTSIVVPSEYEEQTLSVIGFFTTADGTESSETVFCGSVVVSS